MEAILINFICASVFNFTDAKSQTACSQAATATSIHYGFRDDFNKIDKNLEDKTKYYEKKATRDLNESAVLLAATAYSLYANKGINVNFKFKPVADNLSISLNNTSGALTLSWTL